jgi:hypothetical protein
VGLDFLLGCSERQFSALIAFATTSVAGQSIPVTKIAKAKQDSIGFAAGILLVLRTVVEAWRNRHVCFEPTYGHPLKEGLE